MDRTLLTLLAALLLSLAGAQEDHSDHADHDATEATPSQIQIDLGDRSFALLPLVARTDTGYHGTLVLTPTEAMDATGAMDGGLDDHADHEGAADHEGDHTETEDDHADHEGGTNGDMDHEGDHADHEGGHDHGPTLAIALLDPSGSVAAVTELEANGSAGGAYGLDWFADAATSDVVGLWRLTVTLGEQRADVPIAVVSAESDLTELVAVFAPAPSLSSSGVTESFVYAYRDLEPVHAAMSVQRAMAGMQHATDEDQVGLVHDHFDALSDLVPVGEAMANRSPINFAMAGTWDVTVTIAGLETETLLLAVDVLAE